MTIEQYLEGYTLPAFRPKPVYFVEGDYVIYLHEDVECHEDRIDSLVTIYRAAADGRLVGCKIKSVVAIFKEMGNYRVTVSDGSLTIGMLFMVAERILSKPNGYREFAETFGRASLMQDQIARIHA